MKKILIFLDEEFANIDSKINNKIIGSKYSAKLFFDGWNKVEKKYLISYNPSKHFDSYSSKINADDNFDLFEFAGNIQKFLKSYYFSIQKRRRIIKKIEENLVDIDYVWIRQLSSAGIVLAEMAIEKNIQVIFHFAGECEDGWKNKKFKGLKKLIAYIINKILIMKVLKIAKNSLVTNLCTAKKLLYKLRKINKNTHFFVDSLVKDTINFTQSKQSKRNRFIFVGHLTDEKGVMTVFEAFLTILKSDMTSKLTIIGVGKNFDKIKNKIQELNIKDSVSLMGLVPNVKMSDFYSNHDYLLMPTTYNEGFPRVILESWAHNIIPIVTNVGAISMLAKDNTDILLLKDDSVFSMIQKIQFIQENDKLDEEMRKNIFALKKTITQSHFQDFIYKLVNKH